MKKEILIFMTICMIGFLSCKKKDTADALPAHNGKWSLVYYNPSPMVGATNVNTYSMGDIEWYFNTTNQSITVSVNTSVSSNPLSAGIYSFLLGNHACNFGTNQYFTISNNVEGVLVLDSVAYNKLQITAECLDGAILKFER